MRHSKISKSGYWRRRTNLLAASVLVVVATGFALLTTNYVSAHKTVTIEMGGTKKNYVTVKKRVMDILYEQGIKLGPDDIVQPPLTTELTGDANIRIIQVKKEIVTQEKTIAFNTITKKDQNLLEGTKKVVTEGKPGKVLDVYEVVYQDGKEVARNLVRSQVLQNKVDQVVAIGNKRLLASRGSVTVAGYTFVPRKTIQATLTAYSAAYSKHNGITYSGVKATEGRTVAVDPQVVPLGWWVYIEGYGFRRAEDTGGLIKGNKLDIFFESNEVAKQFGVKKRTVYVIGPKKPS
jgi:3D (Asp-Asp-Asp) domain-containing protein